MYAVRSTTSTSNQSFNFYFLLFNFFTFTLLSQNPSCFTMCLSVRVYLEHPLTGPA